jgi:molecular chaperone DnaK
MGSGIHVGIDLGTSNSAIALFDGDAVSVVGNAAGETLTPSVVRIDARGRRTVGRRAARGLEGDPANTRAEWKRLMGTAERLRFEAAGAALLPEELSAEVLASLLADVRDSAGFMPRAAVISTPALFELPQNHATTRAGRLAGLEEVVLIQEPIASAIAAGWRADQESDGTWLVFDLGGGTLDISLLETSDGRLRVVDHAGDNFLGGKDMDGALVEWAAAALARRGAGDLLRERATARGRRALARLRAACELAKIELSRVERTTIVAADPAAGDNGGSDGAGEQELDITRAELDALVAPFIARSLTAVRNLLAKNQQTADDVARVVLVGGPTSMPGLRARVGELFGGRIATGVDPMTIVARGAALYAGSVGLDAKPASRAAAPAPGLAVRIEHPSVTADLEPFVVGRCLPGGGQGLPDRVRIEREDGLWTGADAKLSSEGSFVIQVRLDRSRRNGFRVRAFDRAGAEVPLATRTFAIVHGVSIGDPPLARGIGVARADDSTHIYFPKGTPLPARRTFAHHTVQAIAAGRGDDALAVPIVQGESFRAHRNRLIGTLHLRGLDRDLPAGSRIEVTLELDRSGQLATRADVPGTGQTFEDLAFVLVPTATVETAERELAATQRRATDVQRRTFQLGVPAAVQAIGEVSALLAEAERALPAARAGDVDATQKLHRLLLDANCALDDAEALLEWPDLEAEARRCTLTWTPVVAQWGTPSEQQLYEQELAAAAQARKRSDAAELELHLDAMRSLGRAAYCRDPRAISDAIDWAAAHVTEAMDVAAASSLLDRARALQAQAQGIVGGPGALHALVTEIWRLFPTSPELRAKSFDSSIR